MRIYAPGHSQTTSDAWFPSNQLGTSSSLAAASSRALALQSQVPAFKTNVSSPTPKGDANVQKTPGIFQESLIDLTKLNLFREQLPTGSTTTERSTPHSSTIVQSKCEACTANAQASRQSLIIQRDESDPPQGTADTNDPCKKLMDIIEEASQEDASQLALDCIKEKKDINKLRQELKDKEKKKAASELLQKTRISIIEEVFEKIKKSLEDKYGGITVELKNFGNPGFDSDLDYNVKTKHEKAENHEQPFSKKTANAIKASIEGVREIYEKLEAEYGDSVKSLDANFYHDLHEDEIRGSSNIKAGEEISEEDQIIQHQDVVSLAEMRMKMSSEQWEQYKTGQITFMNRIINDPGEARKDAFYDGVQEKIYNEIQEKLKKQFEEAEELAKRMETKSTEEYRLKQKQAQGELEKALSEGKSAFEIRQLMARIMLLEPDGYATRAAVKGVVDFQQILSRIEADGLGELAETAEKEAKRDYRKEEAEKERSKKKKIYESFIKGRDDSIESLTQEASSSLAQMLKHAKLKGNSLYDAKQAAKYLERIEVAYIGAKSPFFERLDGSYYELTELRIKLMKAKKSNDDKEALECLKGWGKKQPIAFKNDQELQDEWVVQALSLAQEMVVMLRHAEHVKYAKQTLSNQKK